MQKHHSILIDALCKELECKDEDLMDIELCLADTQPAVCFIIILIMICCQILSATMCKSILDQPRITKVALLVTKKKVFWRKYNTFYSFILLFHFASNIFYP